MYSRHHIRARGDIRIDIWVRGDIRIRVKVRVGLTIPNRVRAVRFNITLDIGR